MCKLTTVAALNGLTVRQVLAISNTVLGGGNGPYLAAELWPFLRALNAAYVEGKVSTYAQQHLFFGSCPP